MFNLNSRGFLMMASRGERWVAQTRVYLVGSKKCLGDGDDNAKGGISSGDDACVKYGLNDDKGELVRVRGSTRGKYDDSLDCAQVRALGHTVLVDERTAGLQHGGNGATMGTRQTIDSMG
jgi:hypothetical protein